jgi:hypothetical protein|tara:strand:- start:1007 stop:1324 length:318 start_codon:yes stop_codon:yes gene_type:complete
VAHLLSYCGWRPGKSFAQIFDFLACFPASKQVCQIGFGPFFAHDDALRLLYIPVFRLSLSILPTPLQRGIIEVFRVLQPEPPHVCVFGFSCSAAHGSEAAHNLNT